MFWRKSKEPKEKEESKVTEKQKVEEVPGGVRVDRKEIARDSRSLQQAYDIALKGVEDEIQRLAVGEILIYKLPEMYREWAAFLIVELNPAYPGKGKKYVMNTDKIVDGKPAGQRGNTWQSDKVKDIADWIAQRHGERFV